MELARHTGTLPAVSRRHARDATAVPVSLAAIAPIVAAIDMAWIVLTGVATGHLYHAVVLNNPGGSTEYLGSAIAVAVLYAAFASAADVYRASNLVRLRWQIGRCMLVWAMPFLFLATLAFLLKIGELFSRGEMLLFFANGLVVTLATRLMVARACAHLIRARALAPHRIVVLGTAEQIEGNDALAAIESYGYAVVRTIQLDTDPAGAPVVPGKVRMREIISYVRRASPDEIVLAIPWDRADLLGAIEAELRVLPLPVKLVPDITAGRVLNRPLFEIGPTTAVELQRAPMSLWQRRMKRIMDEVLAAIALVLLLPLFAVIALAIALESPGPILFQQTRVGFNGRPFRIYKFRTMSTQDDGPVVVQATQGDRRVTHLGRILRKLSIDELPQLLNVLRGEMSLVGPRPHALAHDNEYDRLIDTYAIRHKMKPGITGWAQVNGFRGETRELRMMQQRVENDIWYIEYWSLWLDIRILLLTVFRVLKSPNAY